MLIKSSGENKNIKITEIYTPDQYAWILEHK